MPISWNSLVIRYPTWRAFQHVFSRNCIGEESPYAIKSQIHNSVQTSEYWEISLNTGAAAVSCRSILCVHCPIKSAE